MTTNDRLPRDLQVEWSDAIGCDLTARTIQGDSKPRKAPARRRGNNKKKR